jgi:hypothetical protein
MDSHTFCWGEDKAAIGLPAAAPRGEPKERGSWEGGGNDETGGDGEWLFPRSSDANIEWNAWSELTKLD